MVVKYISYIISVYMLLLAMFPCCEVDDCPDEKPPTEQTGHHQNGNEDDCGNCSPFFSCEGCATASITVDTIHYTVNTFFSPQEYTGFIAPVMPMVHYDFWQPPRLG